MEMAKEMAPVGVALPLVLLENVGWTGKLWYGSLLFREWNVF